jgi:NAD(P)-dependent dehydrogenase (short-subunit alcohol dehydrogenase family)
MSKVWFITGSSRGLGRELVRAALDNGDAATQLAEERAGLEPRATDYESLRSASATTKPLTNTRQIACGTIDLTLADTLAVRLRHGTDPPGRRGDAGGERVGPQFATPGPVQPLDPSTTRRIAPY